MSEESTLPTSPTSVVPGSSSFSGLSFQDFYHKLKGRPSEDLLPEVIIGLDPGETTGVAIFHRLSFINTFQMNTSIIEWGVDHIQELIKEHWRDHHPTQVVVVIEDYRIYSWKANEHKWAGLLTPRLIGVTECLCRLHKIRLVKQSAQTGKAFMTDEKLKQFGFYKEGLQHGRDATRHAAQFLLFGDI
jgi:hypothetical protein